MLKQALKRHWCGEYSLLVTLLVTLLSVRVLAGWGQAFVTGLGVYPWISISVAILVWQIVGSWRACDRHLKAQGGLVMYWSVLAMLLVIVVLTVLQIADLLTGRRTVTEQSSLPVVAETPLLPVHKEGTTVLLKGDFSWELRRAFLNTLEATPTITTVTLDSHGGLVFVGRALALSIAEHQLNTHVEHRCYSACTIAFIAGVARSLADKAELGFHQYLLENQNQTHGISVQEQLDVDRKHFASRGVSQDFIKQLFVAEHTGLWVPDHQRLLEAGVLTK